MKIINHKNNNYIKGFTLIELLVVIAIIGLLASIVLVALNSARQKSRVAKRVADLAQIQKALELYYNDNGSYPYTGPPITYRSQCAGWVVASSTQVVWDVNLSKGIVPTYMSAFPADPSMATATNQNCYLYASNGTDYKLLDYQLTDMTPVQINQYPTLVDPARNGVTTCGGVSISPNYAYTWADYTPAAQCW